MINYEKLLQWRIKERIQTYTVRDSVLYSLAVGVGSSDPNSTSTNKFLDVNRGNALAILPSMAVILALPDFWIKDPDTGIVWQQALHGEQSLELHSAIPPDGTVISAERVVDVFDKGQEKGAIMLLERKLTDASTGALLATMGMTSFLRGNGGFGGSAEGAPKPHLIPKDLPADHVIAINTRVDQAALYSLCGDTNPIHLDPTIATSAGFSKPILHGLCTYGIACTHLLTLLCNDAPEKMVKLNARFSSPVFPGDVLQLSVWEQSEETAAFKIKNLSHNKIALDNGYVQFRK